MKNIPTNFLIGATAVLLLGGLVLSAFVGPRLISYITVGFGGEGYKKYSTEGFDTGLEFAPNMFHAESYETFTQWKPSIFADGRNMQFAPNGTVPRSNAYIPEDHKHYYLPDTPEGYEASKAIKANPLVEAIDAMEEGKRAAAFTNLENRGKNLYVINCAICHGEDGAGQGKIVANDKYPSPGAYSAKNTPEDPLTEGRMFHVLTYGKGLMGSYASQLTPEERWATIYYVKKNFVK